MFATIILLWLCVCFIIIQMKSQRPKNFPPGPLTLPVLGNLLNLSLENPLKDFERVRKNTKINYVFSFVALVWFLLLEQTKCLKWLNSKKLNLFVLLLSVVLFMWLHNLLPQSAQSLLPVYLDHIQLIVQVIYVWSYVTHIPTHPQPVCKPADSPGWAQENTILLPLM